MARSRGFPLRARWSDLVLVADGFLRPIAVRVPSSLNMGSVHLCAVAYTQLLGGIIDRWHALRTNDAARRATHHLGFRNAHFEVASADRLMFPADTFDAVVNRFGVMFFPSPVDGVREMLRVLKPGRKLALAVWHFAENNPFHYELARVIERFVDSPPAAPDAPDAFRFASPGKLRGALAEAGAMSPSERLLQFTIQASTSVEDFWTLRCEMSEKLREKLATLSGEQLTEVKRQALEVLRRYSTERGMSFPAEVLIVTGTKIRQA